MDAERVLLLLAVALAALFGAGTVLWRRTAALRTHAMLQIAIGAAAVAGLVRQEVGHALAWPLFLTWGVASVAPMALARASRSLASQRRFAGASQCAALASGLLLVHEPLRRESRLYAALDAADRGDAEACRERLDELAALEGDGSPAAGALGRALCLTAARRWTDLLREIDGAGERTPLLLAMEANASCETGDLRRALRAERELARLFRDDAPLLVQVRRAILAASGRAVFLEEAIRTRMPIADGPAGAALLALARALEASGDGNRAAEVYRESAAVARGSLRRDAEEGAARCARGEARPAVADELEVASLQDLERACRATERDVSARPLLSRAPATVIVCALTLLAGAACFAFLGTDVLSLVAAGALSAPLVRDDGEWWRLVGAMFLHAGPGHLVLNVASIAVVGIPYEERAGSVRTTIVYVLSGIAASAASVFGNDTDVGVGASGAAMGLFGALGVLLLLRGHLFDARSRRSWLAAYVMMLVANAALGAAAHRVVDNAAHAGGLVAGALVAWILLPAPLDSEIHRAARRMAAAGLLTLVAVCEGAVLRDLRDWQRSELESWRGAAARVPAWLVFEDRGPLGVVGARRPLPFVLQMGREPEAHPDAAELLGSGVLSPPGGGSGGGGSGGGGSGGGEPSNWVADETLVREEGTLRIEETVWRAGAPSETDWTDTLLGFDEGPAVRFVVMRRGRAFAAVAVPADAESRECFDPVLREIGRTLAPATEEPPR